MPSSLDALISTLDGLLAELDRAELASAEQIAAVAEVHHAGAVNLVHYRTLRGHDRRELQTDLIDAGLTSLATAEASVQVLAEAARSVLAALRGDAGPWKLGAVRVALDASDEILEQNADSVFGPMRPGRPTRIMVTLPSEAADDAGLVAGLVDAGMDVARVNCAHDDPAAWGRMAAHVRAAAAAAGRPVLVSMDLPGPKVRTGPITAGPAIGRARVRRDTRGDIVTPARIWLTSCLAPAPAPAEEAEAVQARPVLAMQVDPGWLGGLVAGDVITLRDLRGPRRKFTVTDVGAGGMLAAGPHQAYILDGTKLSSRGHHVSAEGIPRIPGRLSLDIGDELVLCSDLSAGEVAADGRAARVGCTLPEAVLAIQPGDPVLFDDGAVTAVAESTGDGAAHLRVTQVKPGGQRLGAEKGINLPATVLPITALTTEDQSHLKFIAAHGDLVAISFVRTAADIDHILDCLAAAGASHLGLVLKIETRQGFENLPGILLAAMRHPRLAVMIARGDLAAEIGFERLAEVPRQILALCEAAHIPAIWATQVLESLAKTGQPSRAEITDAAAAQRAECVMLNKGPHILDAIHTLDNILGRMGEAQHKSRSLMRHIHSWDPARDPAATAMTP